MSRGSFRGRVEEGLRYGISISRNVSFVCLFCGVVVNCVVLCLEIRKLRGHNDAISKLHLFNRSQNNFISASETGEIKIWNTQTGAQTHSFQNPNDKAKITALTLSYDDLFIVTGSDDSKVLVSIPNNTLLFAMNYVYRIPFHCYSHVVSNVSVW